MLKASEPASENCDEGDECVSASQTQEDPRVTLLLIHNEGVIQAPGGDAPGCPPEVVVYSGVHQEQVAGSASTS